MISSKLKTIKSLFEIHGKFIVILYMLNKLKILSNVKDVFWIKASLKEYCLPGRVRMVLDRAERSSPIAVKMLDPSDVCTIEELSKIDKDTPKEYILDALRNGRRIAFTCRGKEICSFMFIGLDEMGIFGKNHRMPADVAYLYETFTRPEFRGKGHYMKLLEYVINYLRNARINKVFCLVYRDNEQPLSNLAKMGFITYAHFIYVQFLGLNIYFSKDILPGGGSACGRPRFHLVDGIPMP